MYLTKEQLDAGRDTVIVESPHRAPVILGWKDGRLVGVENLDAINVLHRDLVDRTEDITSNWSNTWRVAEEELFCARSAERAHGRSAATRAVAGTATRPGRRDAGRGG